MKNSLITHVSMVACYNSPEKRGWLWPEGTGINMNYHKYRQEKSHSDMQYISKYKSAYTKN